MSTKITKSQLAEIIKTVVRECINERKDKWIKTNPAHKGDCTPMTKPTCTGHKKAFAKRAKAHNLEEGQMQEVAPPGWGPDKKHANLYNKIKAQYPDNDQAAYATMWKIHNKLKECMDEAGLTSEAGASYKVAPDTSATVEKDNAAVAFQDNPKISEASYKVAPKASSEVQKDDKARTNQTEPKMNEASYKVVAPRQAEVQKDDKARKIQTDPKMCETAYKTQGPGGKTFKDSPQFPEAWNDPKNA